MLKDISINLEVTEEDKKEFKKLFVIAVAATTGIFLVSYGFGFISGKLAMRMLNK